MPDLRTDQTEDQSKDQTDIAEDNSEEKGKGFLDNRHLFRQILVQQLYQKYYHQDHEVQKLSDHVVEFDTDLELEYISSKLARKLRKSSREMEEKLAAISPHIDAIDEVITKLAPAWPLNQINPVDLQILRLAIYEGFIEKEIPAKVAIDEGIELARDFGSENDAKFVSGVLGNLYADSKLQSTLK